MFRDFFKYVLKQEKKFDIKSVGLVGIIVQITYVLFNFIKNIVVGLGSDYETIRDGNADFARKNFRLAIYMFKSNQLRDALFRLFLSKLFYDRKKNPALLYYYYAEVYCAMGKMNKAILNLDRFVALNNGHYKTDRANNLLKKIERSMKFNYRAK